VLARPTGVQRADAISIRIPIEGAGIGLMAERACSTVKDRESPRGPFTVHRVAARRRAPPGSLIDRGRSPRLEFGHGSGCERGPRVQAGKRAGLEAVPRLGLVRERAGRNESL
jgi:hypothetical protein